MWIVGGAIRDYFLKKEIKDIDFAINIDINVFIKSINKTQIKVITRNVDYGTVSLILNNKEYQITSLRNDLVSYGRQASIEQTDKIELDASRRDFTVNAIYLDSLGNLFDPFNGIDDIKNRKLRFIGDPIKRCEEDYLRVIRFCRFYSLFPNKKISNIFIKNILVKLDNINLLSNKRMKDELTKILNNKNFELSLSMMQRLSLDKYILYSKNIQKNERENKGFKIKNFKILKYLKFFGSDVIDDSKLDLLSIFIPHLYDFNQLQAAYLRLEFSKKTMKYYNFFNQIKSIYRPIDVKNFKDITNQSKKIEIIKTLWKMKNRIFFLNKLIYINERIPISWCKLGLFHILPYEDLKKINVLDIHLPKCPFNINHILQLSKVSDYNEIKLLLFKAEQYWVNNNFSSSLYEIQNFFKINFK